MVNKYPTTTLRDEEGARGVMRVASERGFETQLRLCDRAGDVAYRVVVDCLPEDLRAIVRESRRRQSAWQAWQGAVVPPDCAGAWRGQFNSYLRRRWFDSSHPAAPTHADHRGPGAFADHLAPLIACHDARIGYDLSDPLTWSVWVEYLSEFSERRKAWRAFLRQHGPCDAL